MLSLFKILFADGAVFRSLVRDAHVCISDDTMPFINDTRVESVTNSLTSYFTKCIRSSKKKRSIGYLRN